MKILLLHQYFMFPDDKSGTRTYDLARGFLDHGMEVEVFTSTSNEKYRQDKRWVTIQREGLTVHYIYLPYSNTASYSSRLLVFMSFLWFSTLKLLSVKGDLVLATSTPLTIGIPALIKRFIHKTPFIFEVRDVWPEAVVAIGALKNRIVIKMLYSLEKLIYNKASALVPLSDDMRHSILSRYPRLIHKPVEVIENISVIERFQEGFDPEAAIIEKQIGFKPRFTILYAGTLGRVNGINYVINLATETLKLDPALVFVLVGDGAMKENVKAQAINQGVLHKNVFLLNPVSKNVLPQMYFEADMGSSFVIDIKELGANSANKFFDTLAAGRPVLINHGGWQKKVIEEREIGYVLGPTIDKKDIEKFVRYTQNQNLQASHRRNALKVAKEKYSLEEAVSRYVKVIKSINNKAEVV